MHRDAKAAAMAKYEAMDKARLSIELELTQEELTQEELARVRSDAIPRSQAHTSFSPPPIPLSPTYLTTADTSITCLSHRHPMLQVHDILPSYLIAALCSKSTVLFCLIPTCSTPRPYRSSLTTPTRRLWYPILIFGWY